MGICRVPWLNTSLCTVSFSHPKIVWLDRGCRGGYAGNTDSRRELSVSQRRSDFKAMFSTCFALALTQTWDIICFPTGKNRSGKHVNRVVTQWSQGHTLRFEASELRTKLRSHLHWLTVYLTEVTNDCIFAGLSDCWPKLWIHVVFWYFCAVNFWGAFFRQSMVDLGIRCICEFLGTFLLVFSVAWQGMECKPLEDWLWTLTNCQ